MSSLTLHGQARGGALAAAWRGGVICGAAMAMFLTVAGPAQDWEDETPTETDVAFVTGEILDRAHMPRQPLDDQLSTRFLEGYLDALDPARLLCFQSDVDEFAWFRPDLARMTVAEGDTWPAHMIYARILRRLAVQESFETNLLQTARLDFAGHDSWQADRHSANRPRDLTAARALWRENVRADYLQEKLAGWPPDQIVSQLTRRYERRLQMMRQLRADEVLEIYLDALAQAFDPHSDYFGHEEAQEFNIAMNLSLGGIGGSLESRGGYWIVGDMVPGGPAAHSGLLHPGDRILAVAQGDGEPEDVTDMPSSRVLNMIRGPKGSTVRLTILPAGASGSGGKTVSLVRDTVKLVDEYARAFIIDVPQTNRARCRMGVISLTSFYEQSDTNGGGASADTARLIRKLKQEGIAGLILDLRRNTGGSLKEAIDLAGLFIPAGPVVQTRDAKGRIELGRSQAAKALYDGPLVVLTSRLSASSSEIVAGALQDYRRALIVGDSSTFGKGTVQTLVPLRELLHVHGFGEVKVTVGKFYRPSGASTQLKGVAPDIIVPSETDLPVIGEALLPNALPWDTLPPAVYTNFDQVLPVLAALRVRSGARVASDPGFRLLGKELAAAGEQPQPISLNESARRREMAAEAQIQNELHQIRLADAARALTIYDITLMNVDSAGLPPAREPAGGAAVAPTLLPEPSPADDLELRETENILADYIQLLTAAHPGIAAAPPAQFNSAFMRH
jgi:carboxyl-terminal processing protease